MSIPTLSRPRRLAALAAGALALGGGVALAGTGGDSEEADLALTGLVEDVSGACDEAEHAGDPRCTGTARPEDDDRGTTSTTASSAGTSTTAGSGAPGTQIPDEVRTIDAAGAGTVVVAVESGQLRLVSVSPVEGWFLEVEHAAGREVEVDLTRGSVEVDVDVEIEDGRVRERIRVEDDAAGTEVRTEDGVVTRVEDDRSGSSDDDSSGSGHDGSDDESDDRSGDDDQDDDKDDSDDRSGDDDGTDDHDDDR